MRGIDKEINKQKIKQQQSTKSQRTITSPAHNLRLSTTADTVLIGIQRQLNSTLFGAINTANNTNADAADADADAIAAADSITNPVIVKDETELKSNNSHSNNSSTIIPNKLTERQIESALNLSILNPLSAIKTTFNNSANSIINSIKLLSAKLI